MQLKEDFHKLLDDTPDINRHSKWGDVKHKIEADPRYRAIDSALKKEQWFNDYLKDLGVSSWVKVFRIIPEFRILRATFHRKSATKC